MQKLLFVDLNKATLEAVLRSLRRLPWDEDAALHAFMIDTLSNPHALTHQNQVRVQMRQSQD